MDLWDICAELGQRRFVDLTHGFAPGTPVAPGLAGPEFRHFADFARGDLFQTHLYTVAGQCGTHVDPPNHFHAGAQSLDLIPVSEMIAPLVVLDITAGVEADPDTRVTLADLAGWEARHGRVPAGAFVALRSGWSKRWPDQAAMVNAGPDGTRHSPGWSREVLETLFLDRGIRACGHETIDTDAGPDLAGKGPLEDYILGLGRWQIELLTNLDQLPEKGALIVASWPKPIGGSGFPARVFAIL